MKIKKIQFVKGITEGDYSWDENRPQIVLYGRSNAGKSSTINALLNNKTVAKTSGQAGKTKQINFFNINNSFFLLDLPGYGYARGSKDDKQKIDDLIVWFISDTQASKRIHVIVVDAQVGITDLDADMLEYLYRTNDPIILLLNKTDKMNQSEISKVLNDTHSKIAGVVHVVIFSAKDKKGTDKVWKLIDQYI
jgi:GTP-binding protein